jgi:hypothetical protein
LGSLPEIVLQGEGFGEGDRLWGKREGGHQKIAKGDLRN